MRIMSTQQDRYDELPNLRSRLASRLSAADDTDFLRMLWTLNALQTGRVENANRFLHSYPPEAAIEGILGPQPIFPWELETLANELLTTRKKPLVDLDCRNWNSIGALVNQLRAVENAEYGAQRGNFKVFVEMGRIGARQFPWQRGHVGLPQLYRNAFLFGQGQCASYLQDSAGLSVPDMTLIGFSLLALFAP